MVYSGLVSVSTLTRTDWMISGPRLVKSIVLAAFLEFSFTLFLSLPLPHFVFHPHD